MIAQNTKKAVLNALIRRTKEKESFLKRNQQVVLSIIVVTHSPVNRVIRGVNLELHKTRRCLESIMDYTHLPYELIIIDNGSILEMTCYLKSLERIKPVFNKEDIGTIKAWNQGLEIARGKYVSILDHGQVVSPYWAERLIGQMVEDERIGIVGIEAFRFDTNGIPYRIKDGSDFDFIASLGMMIRKEVINAIGVFDEAFSPISWEDADYSFRAKQNGFAVLYCPDTGIKGTISFNNQEEFNYQEIWRRNRVYFVNRWGDLIWSRWKRDETS